ncbi:hypothetical protein CHS0354_042350 [Potamilus streckersoni]|uniref:Uncharacterized protein n=1 Tax=Potamilus streckersoni TaxID=2493646 RepID=A0AAE0STL4_9BIVA|nr:hypothetical protein CHS0354_042350 [Potamilus streckersoni]
MAYDGIFTFATSEHSNIVVGMIEDIVATIWSSTKYVLVNVVLSDKVSVLQEFFVFHRATDIMTDNEK